MPTAHALALFALAAAALLLVPGPAVLFIVTQSAEEGPRRGFVSVVGVHLGTGVHTVAAAAGLSALVVSSAVAFSTVKLVGAAYLVVLGVRRLLGHDGARDERVRSESAARTLRRGFVVNVLNPKTALFFLAFLPQFVDPDRTVWPQVLVFGALFATLGLVSDGLYALAAGWVASTLRRRRRALRYASGGIYVLLGGVTALARRAS